MPYIDDSPSSSPHLSSKGRGSRDALASGVLEPSKAVSLEVHPPGVWGSGKSGWGAELCSGPGYCSRGSFSFRDAEQVGDGTVRQIIGNSFLVLNPVEGGSPLCTFHREGHGLLYKLSLKRQVAYVPEAWNGDAGGHCLSKQYLLRGGSACNAQLG